MSPGARRVASGGSKEGEVGFLVMAVVYRPASPFLCAHESKYSFCKAGMLYLLTVFNEHPLRHVFFFFASDFVIYQK